MHINVNIQLYLLFYIKYIRSHSLTHKIYWFRKLRTWLLFCRDMQTFLTLRLFSFPQQATRDHVYVGQVFFQQKQPSQCHQQYRPRKDLVSCRSDTCIQSLDVHAELQKLQNKTGSYLTYYRNINMRTQDLLKQRVIFILYCRN